MQSANDSLEQPPAAVPMIPTDLSYQIPQPPPSDVNNQPIYFSDGQLYPDQLNAQSSNSNSNSNTDALEVALPSELVDVYNHLGIVGRLLTSGSIATMRLLHAVRNFSENLTGILGITSPKFEYEINMHNKNVQEEEQRALKVQQMYSSWQQPQLAGETGPVGQPGQSGLAMQMEPSISQPPPPPTDVL